MHIKFNNKKGLLEVLEEDKCTLYPNSWLRENCRCNKCFYKKGHQRLIEPGDLQLEDYVIAEAYFKDNELLVMWENNHKSHYTLSWLNYYDGFNKKKSDQVYQVPWTTQSLPTIPEVEYEAIVSGQTKEHLKAVTHHGIFLVKNAPVSNRSIIEFANSISFSGVRRTNFGEIFNVKIHDNPNMKLAFTDKRVSLHNDLLIRQQQPSVTLLHCLSNNSEHGGDSLVSDGLAVSNHMRKYHPEYFELLCTVDVEIEDLNQNWHYVSRKPVIDYRRGVVHGIHYNNWERSPYIEIDPELYSKFSNAYKLFCELAHSDDFCHRHVLQSGEIIVVDNTRLLHGRESFQDGSDTIRHLQGCHIDIDDLTSAYRKSFLNSEVNDAHY